MSGLDLSQIPQTEDGPCLECAEYLRYHFHHQQQYYPAPEHFQTPRKSKQLPSADLRLTSPLVKFTTSPDSTPYQCYSSSTANFASPTPQRGFESRTAHGLLVSSNKKDVIQSQHVSEGYQLKFHQIGIPNFYSYCPSEVPPRRKRELKSNEKEPVPKLSTPKVLVMSPSPVKPRPEVVKIEVKPEPEPK